MATPLEISAANKALEGSPLAGLGAKFVAAGDQNGVDWRLLIAIAKSESDLGRNGGARAIHNPFGLGPGITYPSWDAAIDAAARTVANNRAQGRTTVAQIGTSWAPVGAANDPRNLNSNWVKNTTAFLRQLGGDPSRTGRVVTSPLTGAPQPGAGGFFAPGGAGDALKGTDNDLAGLLGKLNPVGAVLGFLKDYVIRILAFLLLGVIGVWLIGQGASRAFGTPAPTDLVKTAATRGAR